jgi:hypothetical protein
MAHRVTLDHSRVVVPTATSEEIERMSRLGRWVLAGAAAMVALGGAAASASGQAGRGVTIAASDYAYQVPDTMPAGVTTLALANHGAFFHEMMVMRLKPGRTLAEALQAKTPDERRAVLDGTVAIVFAQPGQESIGRVTIDLTSGQRYVIVCNVRDAADKPSHVTMGMAGSFYVK